MQVFGSKNLHDHTAVWETVVLYQTPYMPGWKQRKNMSTKENAGKDILSHYFHFDSGEVSSCHMS